MHKEGHIGVSLLIYSPFAWYLVENGSPGFALAGIAFVGGFAMLPDIDMKTSLVKHRGFTHTFLFAIIVGVILGYLTNEAGLGLIGAPLGFLIVVSHIIADTLTPMGVKPFWPLSSKQLTLGVVRASNPYANKALFFIGIGAIVYSIGIDPEFVMSLVDNLYLPEQ